MAYLSRRSFLAGMGLTTLSFLGRCRSLAGDAGEETGESGDMPNVVLIYVDDLEKNNRPAASLSLNSDSRNQRRV